VNRAHVYWPIVTNTGNLVTYARLTFLDADTGQVSDVPIYRAEHDTDPVPNPVTVSPGIIDVWVDDPTRFDIEVWSPGQFSGVLAGIDLTADPAEVARTTAPASLAGSRQSGQIPSGTTGWIYPPLVPVHDHDGAAAGSTVLDPSTHPDDDDPNQTLVGYGTVTATAADQSGSTAFGAGSTSAASGTTALGRAATAVDEVTLGAGSPGVSGTDVTLAALYDGTNPSKVTNAAVTLRSVLADATSTTILGGLPVPGLPAGVTTPFWLAGDVVVFGSLQAPGEVRLGQASTDLVGFYGDPGATQVDIAGSGATGVLASLLAALEAYGLVTVS
jgi:hypothetical protein